MSRPPRYFVKTRTYQRGESQAGRTLAWVKWGPWRTVTDRADESTAIATAENMDRAPQEGSREYAVFYRGKRLGTVNVTTHKFWKLLGRMRMSSRSKNRKRGP